MKMLHKLSDIFFQNKLQETEDLPATVIKEEMTESKSDLEDENEVVECVISPAKIVCPDCGGITLEGLDYCDKCGGELKSSE